MEPTIEDVRRFWDSAPLGVGVVRGEVGSKEWFQEFDRIKTNFGLLGVLDAFAPASLRGQRVLDVGCGPGFWARHLTRLGVDYVGIDISPRSVALARRSLELHGLRGRIEVGNAEALPFDDESFDAVISEGVIHHTPDTRACIDEIHRVLRPGGRAAVSVYHRGLLLRSPLLFALTKGVMRAADIVQRGRGREAMIATSNADAFVRMAMAREPGRKGVHGAEFRDAFDRFLTATSCRYFFPMVRGIGTLPVPLRRAVVKVGLMVLVVAHK
jgi:ubiquinone/menaquinone biosynthesis C-methylase UbiE